jgi:unsaturated chondroitin disaccharide hydrolase
MKKLVLAVGLFFTTTVFAQPKVNVAKQMQLSLQQYKGMLQQFNDYTLFPQSLYANGKIKQMKSDWWCSGFFAGSLWYLAEYTKDSAIKQLANNWTVALEKEQYNTQTHDLGFMLYCSYGNGLRLTHDAAYKPVMLNGAASLATRFNPTVGLIKSWNYFKGYKYPVIIDNMMNLEYLFWAAKESGNKNYYNICVTHADNTLKNHFRPDYSSYHVVCYDTLGNVLAKKTAQGFADSSAWARGQAWGLYGYTVMYRETKDKKYLAQAINIARFFMRHPNLPKDKIPFWDFNSPLLPNDVRDASAAAVTASALLELSGYVGKKLKKEYLSFAEQVLQSLSSSAYFAKEGNGNFLLKHNTGHKPENSEIDTPIIYADYYYLEALIRYNNITKKIRL